MKLTATSTPSNNLRAAKNELKMENRENQCSQQGSNYEIRQQELLRSYNHDQHLQQQQNKKGPLKTASKVLSEPTAIIPSGGIGKGDASLWDSVAQVFEGVLGLIFTSCVLAARFLLFLGICWQNANIEKLLALCRY